MISVWVVHKNNDVEVTPLWGMTSGYASAVDQWREVNMLVTAKNLKFPVFCIQTLGILYKQQEDSIIAFECGHHAC